MGNMIGTITFDKVEHHRFNKILGDLQLKYNLADTDPNYIDYKNVYQEHFSVSINGFSIWLTGYDRAKRIINSFLNDAKTQLSQDGAKHITTDLQYLPL